MVRKIEKLGRVNSSVALTVLSMVISQIITYSIYKIGRTDISLYGRISSFVSPLLITPFLGWWFLGLLIRISKLEKEMRLLATYDTLTGVHSRYSFLAICSNILNLLNRDNLPITVLYIDLDHFKHVNDTFGHDTGDYVLKSIGKYILDNIRKSDIAGRMGGEEFVVALPNTIIDDGINIAEKLRKGIYENKFYNRNNIAMKISVSIGISSNSDIGNNAIEELLKKADIALYDAKRNGRNRLFVYQDCVQLKYSNKHLELIGNKNY